MKIVCNLITELVVRRDTFSRRNSKSDDWFPMERELNIFDVARLNYFPTNKNHFLIFSLPLRGMRYEGVFQMLSNPLLPNNIAQCLNTLRNEGRIKLLRENEVDSPYLIVNYTPNSFKSERTELLTESQYITNINSYLKTCKDLHKSITDWLEKNGIDDINLVALERNLKKDPEPNA